MSIKIKDIKISTQNTLIFLLTFSIILHTNSCYQFMGFISNGLWSIAECMLCVVIFYFYHKRNKIKVLKKEYKVLFVYYLITTLSLISNVFNEGDEVAFAIKYMFFVPFMYLLFSCTKNNFFDNFVSYFIKITVVLAIISLPFYLFGQVLGIISPNMSIAIQWGSVPVAQPSYFLIHFITQEISRNSGIFTEAPMYSLVLSVALFMTFFKENQQKRQLLLVITLFTTNTLTSMIVICVFFLCYYFSKKRKKGSMIKMLSICLVIVLIPVAAYALSYFISMKLETVGGSNSLMMRFDDYAACLKVFDNNKFFGIGYGYEIPIRENMTQIRQLYKMLGLANSIGVYLAQGGIVMMILLVWSYIGFLKEKQRSYKFFGFFFIVISFMSIFLYTNLFLIIFSFGLSKKQKNKSISELVVYQK